MPLVPIPPLLALATAAVATWELGISTETYGRPVLQPDLVSIKNEQDLVFLPRAGVATSSPGSRFGLVYQPRFAMTLEKPESRLAILHPVTVDADLRLDPLWSVRLSENAQYGVVETSPLGQLVIGQPGTLQPTNAGAQPTIFSSSTSAALSYAASRRTTVTLSGNVYFLTGADDPSRVVYPRQWAPQASLGLAWNATPRDVLSTTGGASVFLIEDGRRNFLFTLDNGWQRSLTAFTSLRLSAGGSAALAQADAGAPHQLDVLPMLSAELVRAQAAVSPFWEGSLLVRFSPYADRTLGGIFQSLYGRAAGSFEVLRGLRLGASASATTSMTMSLSQTGTTMANGDVSLSWHLARDTRAHFSVGVGWLDDPAGPPHPLQFGANVGITWMHHQSY